MIEVAQPNFQIENPQVNQLSLANTSPQNNQIKQITILTVFGLDFEKNAQFWLSSLGILSLFACYFLTYVADGTSLRFLIKFVGIAKLKLTNKFEDVLYQYQINLGHCLNTSCDFIVLSPYFTAVDIILIISAHFNRFYALKKQSKIEYSMILTLLIVIQLLIFPTVIAGYAQQDNYTIQPAPLILQYLAMVIFGFNIYLDYVIRSKNNQGNLQQLKVTQLDQEMQKINQICSEKIEQLSQQKEQQQQQQQQQQQLQLQQGPYFKQKQQLMISGLNSVALIICYFLNIAQYSEEHKISFVGIEKEGYYQSQLVFSNCYDASCALIVISPYVHGFLIGFIILACINRNEALKGNSIFDLSFIANGVSVLILILLPTSFLSLKSKYGIIPLVGPVLLQYFSLILFCICIYLDIRLRNEILKSQKSQEKQSGKNVIIQIQQNGTQQ